MVICIFFILILQTLLLGAFGNVCSIDNGGCEHICAVSSLGFPICSCRQGYELSIDEKNCVANPEYLNCDINNGGCDFFCLVKLNRVVCTCPVWYHLGKDGKRCLSNFETRCKIPRIVNGEYGRYIDSNFEKVNRIENITTGGVITLRCYKNYVAFPSTKPLNNGFYEEDMDCDNGEWSKSLSCKLIACRVPDVKNGEFVKYTSPVVFEKVDKTVLIENKQTLTLRCHEGYAPFRRQSNDSTEGVSEEEITCENGKWSKNLSCLHNEKINSCSYVPRIETNEPAVNSSQLRRSHGHVITYAVWDDSNLVEKGKAVCHFGKWIFSSGLKNTVCSLPKEPGPCRNYTIKWFFDLANGGCSRFWYGGCDGNGNVFSTQKECESVCVKSEVPGSITCPLFESPREIEVIYTADLFVGSHAIFKCSTGDILQGNTYAVCLSNGTWSHSLPSCKGSSTAESVTCSEFALSGGLLVSYSKGGTSGSIATFRCPLSKVLIGNSEAICLSNGTWSKSPPLCKGSSTAESVTCSEFALSAELLVSYSKGRASGSKATFRCPLSKVLKGDSEAICLSNGTWSKSPPLCKDPAMCQELKAHSGLQISYTKGLSHLSKALFACSPPKGLVGVTNAMCLDGFWSHSLPKCEEPVTCPAFERLPSLKISYSKGFSIGSNASFSCAPPKILSRNSFAICMDNGLWSDQPKCIEPVICEMFEPRPSLEISYSNEFSIGSTASFICSPPSVLDGVSESTCMANGSWSHSLPQCIVPLPCPEFQLSFGLKVSYSKGFSFGSEARFSCSSPKVLIGNPKAVCLSNGTWSHTSPECKSVGTGCILKKSENSVLDIVPEKPFYAFGEQVHLYCPSRMHLSPNIQTIMCLGSWSDNLPDCVKTKFR